MLIIPAIDLKDGKCVRLKQGRMEDDTVFQMILSQLLNIGSMKARVVCIWLI